MAANCSSRWARMRPCACRRCRKERAPLANPPWWGDNAAMTIPRLAAAILAAVALVSLCVFMFYIYRGPACVNFPNGSHGPPFFEDVTAETGIEVTYRDGQEA